MPKREKLIEILMNEYNFFNSCALK